MRRIHWRATAHRDTLMVRQEEQESSPAATVVLDRAVSRWSPAATHAPGSDAAFETAVTACVSVVARLVHEGYTVDVVDSDGTLLTDPVDGGDDVEARAAAAGFRLGARPRRRPRAPRGPGLGRRADRPGGRHHRVSRCRGPGDARRGRAALGTPVLLVVTEHVDLGRLRAGGWRAAVLPPGGDVASAWDDAMEQGYAGVGR